MTALASEPVIVPDVEIDLDALEDAIRTELAKQGLDAHIRFLQVRHVRDHGKGIGVQFDGAAYRSPRPAVVPCPLDGAGFDEMATAIHRAHLEVVS